MVDHDGQEATIIMINIIDEGSEHVNVCISQPVSISLVDMAIIKQPIVSILIQPSLPLLTSDYQRWLVAIIEHWWLITSITQPPWS